ncbi:g72 [Coccomyxa elongata]
MERPEGDQVLLKIAYAGVNGGCETFRCRGSSYTPFVANQKAEKFVLGAEASGTVVAVGENVKCLKVGDAVTCSGSGGFAEFIVASAQSCFPVKEASAEAVVLTLSGLTAAVALKATGGPLKAGEHALVTAAGGATGHMGVQLALLAGCHVVAVCGSAAKAERLRDLGASRIINYREEDVGEVLRREYPEGIDVAYEGVGGPLRDAVLDNLSEHGRMLVVGYISEYPHVKPDDGEAQGSGGLPPSRELFWQRQTVKIGGRTIYGDVWSGASRQDIPAFRRELFDLYEDGQLKAWVDSRRFHGLEQVSDAIEYMLTGQAIGKVVVSF